MDLPSIPQGMFRGKNHKLSGEFDDGESVVTGWIDEVGLVVGRWGDGVELRGRVDVERSSQ